jgi:hypothetical protein
MPLSDLPIVPAEPVPGDARHTFLFQGQWCAQGGFVGKRGDFAVLQSRAGLTVMVDRRAVELAAMALGIELARPAAPSVRVVCAWGGAVMVEGPLDAQGHASHGICPCCRKRETETARAGRTAEIGR